MRREAKLFDPKWAAVFAGAAAAMLLLLGAAPTLAASGSEPTTSASATVTVPQFIEITINASSINYGSVGPGQNSTRQALQLNITDNTNVDVNFTFRPDANMSLNPSNIINWSGVNVSSGTFWYNFSYDDSVELNTYGAYAFHPQNVAFGTYTANQTGFFDRPRPALNSNTSTDFHTWANVPRGATAGTYSAAGGGTDGSFTIRASRCEVNC